MLEESLSAVRVHFLIFFSALTFHSVDLTGAIKIFTFQVYFHHLPSNNVKNVLLCPFLSFWKKTKKNCKSYVKKF